jgi:hypothetical protein
MKLTKTVVEGALPKAQRYRLNDSLVPGLCLLVLPSGARTYYVRFRQLDGRQLEMKQGTPVDQGLDLVLVHARRVSMERAPGRSSRCTDFVKRCDIHAAWRLLALNVWSWAATPCTPHLDK